MNNFLLSLSTASMSSTFAFLILLLLLSVLWITKSVLKHMGSKKREAPEPSGAWPILGHLPLLGGPTPPHIILGDLADKYGPIFTIRLGVHRALIVSSSEIAKQCFTTNDKAFCNRPKLLAAENMGYNYAMFGLSPYGHYWRQMRKIATLEILSNHRLEMLKRVRETEVKRSVKEIYNLWDKNRDSDASPNKVLVEMKRWFNDVTLNTVFKMVVGKRFVGEATTPYEVEESERCRNALREFFQLSGVFAPGDLFPFLRWLDLGGYEKAMKKTGKELDQVLEGWLRDHKQKAATKQGKSEQDFMGVMLSTLEDAELVSYDADAVNKATCLTMILGGTDTTTTTLTWALALLLNNREALKKAQQELDTCIGRKRLVQDSDFTNLLYLQAILKETLRLYPAAPLSVPHESLEDCITSGYHVPAGTRLIVNLSKLHRDPNVWLNPDEFQPERFLTVHKDIDVRGQNYELLPFGSGRRVCPGISFALVATQLILANLLHGFEITTPTDEAIDMTEAAGMTSIKAAPLQVLLTPRLPPHLYA